MIGDALDNDSRAFQKSHSDRRPLVDLACWGKKKLRYFSIKHSSVPHHLSIMGTKGFITPSGGIPPIATVDGAIKICRSGNRWCRCCIRNCHMMAMRCHSPLLYGCGLERSMLHRVRQHWMAGPMHHPPLSSSYLSLSLSSSNRPKFPPARGSRSPA